MKTEIQLIDLNPKSFTSWNQEVFSKEGKTLLNSSKHKLYFSLDSSKSTLTVRTFNCFQHIIRFLGLGYRQFTSKKYSESLRQFKVINETSIPKKQFRERVNSAWSQYFGRQAENPADPLTPPKPKSDPEPQPNPKDPQTEPETQPNPNDPQPNPNDPQPNPNDPQTEPKPQLPDTPHTAIMKKYELSSVTENIKIDAISLDEALEWLYANGDISEQKCLDLIESLGALKGVTQQSSDSIFRSVNVDPLLTKCFKQSRWTFATALIAGYAKSREVPFSLNDLFESSLDGFTDNLYRKPPLRWSKSFTLNFIRTYFTEEMFQAHEITDSSHTSEYKLPLFFLLFLFRYTEPDWDQDIQKLITQVVARTYFRDIASFYETWSGYYVQKYFLDKAPYVRAFFEGVFERREPPTASTIPCQLPVSQFYDTKNVELATEQIIFLINKIKEIRKQEDLKGLPHEQRMYFLFSLAAVAKEEGTMDQWKDLLSTNECQAEKLLEQECVSNDEKKNLLEVCLEKGKIEFGKEFLRHLHSIKGDKEWILQNILPTLAKQWPKSEELFNEMYTLWFSDTSFDQDFFNQVFKENTFFTNSKEINSFVTFITKKVIGSRIQFPENLDPFATFEEVVAKQKLLLFIEKFLTEKQNIYSSFSKKFIEIIRHNYDQDPSSCFNHNQHKLSLFFWFRLLLKSSPESLNNHNKLFSKAPTHSANGAYSSIIKRLELNRQFPTELLQQIHKNEENSFVNWIFTHLNSQQNASQQCALTHLFIKLGNQEESGTIKNFETICGKLDAETILEKKDMEGYYRNSPPPKEPNLLESALEERKMLFAKLLLDALHAKGKTRDEVLPFIMSSWPSQKDPDLLGKFEELLNHFIKLYPLQSTENGQYYHFLSKLCESKAFIEASKTLSSQDFIAFLFKHAFLKESFDLPTTFNSRKALKDYSENEIRDLTFMTSCIEQLATFKNEHLRSAFKTYFPKEHLRAIYLYGWHIFKSKQISLNNWNQLFEYSVRSTPKSTVDDCITESDMYSAYGSINNKPAHEYHTDDFTSRLNKGLNCPLDVVLAYILLKSPSKGYNDKVYDIQFKAKKTLKIFEMTLAKASPIPLRSQLVDLEFIKNLQQKEMTEQRDFFDLFEIIVYCVEKEMQNTCYHSDERVKMYLTICEKLFEKDSFDNTTGLSTETVKSNLIQALKKCTENKITHSIFN